jgi:hypothetical protein
MSKYLSKDINTLLNKIININNKIFVFQTDVLKTSLYYKVDPLKVAKIFIKNIEKIFYKKTILFPAFSNDIITKKKFDIKRSSVYTGLIPKLILKKNYYRTFSPLHSYLVKGKYINEIKKLKQNTTWGKGSVYEWLEKKNAVWVSLNLNWENGCAFAHRSEEINKVKFRYFKTYSGALYKNGKFIKNISETKYSNYPTKIIKDYSKSFRRLKKRSNNFFFINKGLFANAALTKNIIKDHGQNFKNDKFFGVKNKTEFKNWLRKNRKFYNN